MRGSSGEEFDMRMSYEEAVSTAAANKLSKWPRRGEGSRLEPIAEPSFKTSIRLAPGNQVMTMGSCFARNIEAYFAASGYDVPVSRFVVPAEEQSTSAPEGVLNKYTMASITQELEWVAAVKADSGRVQWKHIDPLMLQNAAGEYFDLQLKSPKWVTRERALERRQQIYDIHVKFFGCDLAVLTPGLTEGWFDTTTGLYIQDMPTRRMAADHPGRFEFRILHYPECLKFLERAVELLASYGTSQIAMTVSPVPLERTMTSKDVFVANTYSKSTLRAAIGYLAEINDAVQYLPSYEKIMLSRESSMWRDDLRHVADAFVGNIVSTFARECSAPLSAGLSDVLAFHADFENGDMEEAYRKLLGLSQAAFDTDMVRFHEYAAILFARNKDYGRAMDHVVLLKKHRPEWKKSYKLEYYVAKKQGDVERAQQAVEHGVKHCKDVTSEDIAILNKRMSALLGE